LEGAWSLYLNKPRIVREGKVIYVEPRSGLVVPPEIAIRGKLFDQFESELQRRKIVFQKKLTPFQQ